MRENIPLWKLSFKIRKRLNIPRTNCVAKYVKLLLTYSKKTLNCEQFR